MVDRNSADKHNSEDIKTNHVLCTLFVPKHVCYNSETDMGKAQPIISPIGQTETIHNRTDVAPRNPKHAQHTKKQHHKFRNNAPLSKDGWPPTQTPTKINPNGSAIHAICFIGHPDTTHLVNMTTLCLANCWSINRTDPFGHKTGHTSHVMSVLGNRITIATMQSN